MAFQIQKVNISLILLLTISVMNGIYEITSTYKDMALFPLEDVQWDVYFQIAFVSAGALKIINASIGLYMMYTNTIKSIRMIPAITSPAVITDGIIWALCHIRLQDVTHGTEDNKTIFVNDTFDNSSYNESDLQCSNNMTSSHYDCHIQEKMEDMENQTQICTPDENQKKGKLCCCGPEEICNYYDGSQYKQMNCIPVNEHHERQMYAAAIFYQLICILYQMVIIFLAMWYSSEIPDNPPAQEKEPDEEEEE